MALGIIQSNSRPINVNSNRGHEDKIEIGSQNRFLYLKKFSYSEVKIRILRRSYIES